MQYTLNKILRAVVIGGVFLLPLTPLIVSGGLFFPFITGKAFFFRFIVEVIFACWVLLALLDPAFRPRRSWLVWILSAFIVIVTLATIFSVNPSRSFWSNFERMEGLVTYLHLAAYFVVLISVFKTDKLWRRLFNVSLGVSLIVVLYGFLQLAGASGIHQSSRLDATFGNAIYLAVYLLIHIFLALYLMLQPTASRALKYLYGILIALQLIILYYTATRGAILGLVAGLFIAAALLLWRGRQTLSRSLKRVAASFLIVVVLLAGGFFLVRNTAFVQSSPVLSRFANISAREATTESRLTIWQMSLKGAKEHPILGWGPENYNLVFNKYYNPKLWRQEQWFDRSHDIFLDWLISAGVLGLASYLGLFVVAVYCLWRRQSKFSVTEASLFTGLLAAYFVHNIFVFDNLMSYILFLTILGYLHFRNADEGAVTKKIVVKTWYWLIVGLVAVGFVVIFYQVEYKPYIVARDLVRALNTSDSGQRLQIFSEALDKQTFGNPEAREQLLTTTYQVLGTENISTATKQAYFDRVVKEFETQIAQTPNDARYQLFYGSFLGAVGQTDKAITLLSRAHELSPGKQSIYFELISQYLQKKDVKKALELAQEAVALDPNYPEARRIYALVLIQSGQTNEAQKFIDEKLPNGSSLELDERFINIFADSGQYGKVLRIWQDKVAQEGSNAENHIHLAAAYVAVGDPADAIKELETAIELDPKNKIEIEKLISDIRAGRNPLQ